MNYDSFVTTAAEILDQRLAPRKSGWLDIITGLRHFALINYSLPAERLRPHIPDRFEIQTFDIGGDELALMSVVPFEDEGFHFTRLPYPRFRFCQTNYRVYVIDKESGEQVVWFFGTTLGSWTVWLCRFLWKIPWHPARYSSDHLWDQESRRYHRFKYETRSKWAPATIEVQDSGEPISAMPGFASLDDMVLTLTHPLDGYYYRLDRKIGGYSVSHDIISLTRGEAVHLHFGLFERLELLDAEEMMRPHSVFLCPHTEFHIYMPPRLA
jgi:hypothetical protein